MATDFDTGLGKTSANFVALTPIDYIARAAEVDGDRLAIVQGPLRQTWPDTYARARRLASALAQAGVGKGDIKIQKFELRRKVKSGSAMDV